MHRCMDAWTCACGLYRNSWQAKRLCDHPCWMRRWIRTLRRSFVCNEFSWFFGMSGMKLYEIMGFSRTAIMALDFGAPSFRVKTKTRQKISKPSHHLLSMSALSAQVGLEALNHLSKQPIIRNLPRCMKHVWGGYHSAQWYLQLANQLVVHRPSTTKTSCIPWHFLARVRPAIKLMVFLSVELRPKPEKVLLEGLEVFILVILGSWAWIVRWKDRHVIVYLLYVGVIMT